MKIIRSTDEMIVWSNGMKKSGKYIALVPTMGFFHKGHLSLMRLASQKADCVVASLFVNPIQFGPQEDLSRYPRDFDRDADAARKEKIDVLFAPPASEIYPENFQTKVRVEGLTDTLCGKSRPGHFDGVTTVVAKLFNIVGPHYAVFGEKDFQQLSVIRRMVKDLNWGIEIIGHPIVREPDGLAMSSRNSYLSPHERQSALCLYHSLQQTRKKVSAGITDSQQLINKIVTLIHSYDNVSIEYVNLIDQESLIDKTRVDGDTILVMAIMVGSTRLIDNGRLF